MGWRRMINPWFHPQSIKYIHPSINSPMIPSTIHPSNPFNPPMIPFIQTIHNQSIRPIHRISIHPLISAKKGDSEMGKRKEEKRGSTPAGKRSRWELSVTKEMVGSGGGFCDLTTYYWNLSFPKSPIWMAKNAMGMMMIVNLLMGVVVVVAF